MKAQAEQSFKDLGDKLRQENESLQETLQAEVKAQEKAREDAQRAREHAEAALQAQIAQVEVEKASATANQSEEEKALARAWEETEALKLQVLTQKTRLKLLEDELRVAQRHVAHAKEEQDAGNREARIRLAEAEAKVAELTELCKAAEEEICQAELAEAEAVRVSQSLASEAFDKTLTPEQGHRRRERAFML